MAKAPQQIRHVMLTPSDFLDDGEYVDWDSRLCGAYFNIILWLYRSDGWMLEDLPKLQKRAQWHGKGFATAWGLLRNKFQIKRGRIRHKRVSFELRKAKEAQQAKHNAGVKGARARWQPHSEGIGKGNAEQNRTEQTEQTTPPTPSSDVPDDMLGAPGLPPFGERPDMATDAATAHLDSLWEILVIEGHKNIPKFTPSQIAKFVKNLHGILEVQKVKANDVHRAWLRYGKRMADPKQKDIPWCPWYIRDLLTRDAARQPARKPSAPSRIQREYQEILAKGFTPSPEFLKLVEAEHGK